MIALPDYLEQSFKAIAEKNHESADQLLARLVEDFLEDYQDIQLAEKTLDDIEQGKTKVLSLADAKKLYATLVN